MHRVMTVFVCLLVILLIGCGPSEAEIAAMTQAAIPTATSTPVPTPTNTPTPTATPIPYDLTVTVQDAEGNPVEWVQIALPESGDETPIAADDSGSAQWANLPSEAITLKVSAPGYFGVEQAATLERGPNEIAVTLEADPNGLMPAAACAPGETLLYVEDFQDGHAQGWGQVEAAVEFNAPNGWGIGPDPDNGEDLVMLGGNAEHTADSLGGYEFEDVVWRGYVKGFGTVPAGRNSWPDMFLFFLQGQDPADPNANWAYMIQMGVSQVFTAVQRHQSPEPGDFGLGMTSHMLKDDTWSYFEISRIDGVLKLWVDGKELKSYEDPQPLPAGTISMGYNWNMDTEFFFAYNNFSVCEPAGEFTSLTIPAP